MTPTGKSEIRLCKCGSEPVRNLRSKRDDVGEYFIVTLRCPKCNLETAGEAVNGNYGVQWVMPRLEGAWNAGKVTYAKPLEEVRL